MQMELVDAFCDDSDMHVLDCDESNRMISTDEVIAEPRPE